MLKAAEFALSGLTNASQQFASAARDIASDPSVNLTHTAISRNSGAGEATLQNGGQGLPKAPFGGDITAFEDSSPSLAESAVSLKEAQVTYQANARVIGALQETQDRVLEILA